MKVSDVIRILDAKVLTKNIDTEHEINTICGCDMMSDVLAYMKHDACLLTGLNNLQVIRTAEMIDVVCIVFVRGKIPSEEMIQMADEVGLYILQSDLPMYVACGKLYAAGFKGGHHE